MSTETEEPTGELVIRTMAMPANTNSNGDIFGGWLICQMDLGASILAQKIARSRVVTVSMDKVHFLHPVEVGDTICCYADLIKIGRTSMQIKLQAWTIAIQQDQRQKVLEGEFTFVAIDNNGRPIPVKR